jgi:hypothetical protein
MFHHKNTPVYDTLPEILNPLLDENLCAVPFLRLQWYEFVFVPMCDVSGVSCTPVIRQLVVRTVLEWINEDSTGTHPVKKIVGIFWDEEVVMPWHRVQFWHLPEGSEEIHKETCQVNWCPRRKLNDTLSKHEVGIFTTQLQCSIKTC